MKLESHPTLKALTQRYLVLRLTESILLLTGVGLVSLSVTRVVASVFVSVAVSAGLAVTAVILSRQKRVPWWNINQLHVANFLNKTYPALQNSCDLLVTPTASSSSLELIQRERVATALADIEQRVKLPHRVPAALLVLMLGAFGVVFLPARPFRQSNESIGTSVDVTPTSGDSLQLASLQQAAITITPPKYTGLAPTTSAGLPLKLREGSQVEWLLSFTSRVDEVSIIISGKDSVNAKLDGGRFAVKRAFTEAGFYQLQWKTGGTYYRSDFYPIEVQADTPPVIVVKDFKQFTELGISDSHSVPLHAVLHDDHRLTGAHIIATVSKGSGESVKFREEKLMFTRPQTFTQKEEHASRTIDLNKLGLEPGDELYFYIEAFDNKWPIPNKSRTETFFIALQDTSAAVAVADEGLGVDLMPEYFRSQRQIIIDSEKLLAEKKRIDQKEFNFKSNELGYDQKVLRLRYGQFLGEEFETAIARVDEGEENEEDVTKQYGHQHDTENEHNQVADKKESPIKPEPDHDHQPGEEENPFEAFVHSHDNAEEATFFVQSVKAKLRAALTLMWDAELYLRMYQPEQSLPYQYKILKLLKEISNDSRIYVHRTGFDPPPLKEEKRLSGDLTEVKNSSGERLYQTTSLYPNIRKTIALLSNTLDSKRPIPTADLEIIRQAGNELAGVAVQQPGIYLKTLSQMKAIADNNVAEGQLVTTATQVRLALWHLIPEEGTTPQRREVTLHAWEVPFIRDLADNK